MFARHAPVTIRFVEALPPLERCRAADPEDAAYGCSPGSASLTQHSIRKQVKSMTPTPPPMPSRARNEAQAAAKRPAHGSQPRNRRTLKRRVRRLIYLSSLINLVIFGMLMLTLVVLIFKPIAAVATNYISSTIAEEINSRPFLEEINIERLEDFDPATPEAQGWIRSLGHMTKVDYFLPFMDWQLGDAKEVAQQAADKVAPGQVELTLDHKEDDMVFMRIELNGSVVYESGEDAPMDWLLATLERYYDAASTKPLLSASGAEIGSVTVGLSPVAALFMLSFTTLLFLVMIVIMLIITLILSKLFTIPILKPLTQLNANIKAIAEEHYEDLADNRIVVKRPLREIEALADSTNLIMRKMQDYADMLQEQNEELEAQNNELQESRAAIQAAQQEIMRKEAALRNLMNHAGQGFLTFGSDLCIHPVYSLQCGNLLAGCAPIAGSKFSELLAQGDDEHRVFLENVLMKVLQEPDPAKRSVYMPLLTEEFEMNGRQIHIDYKIIPDPEREGSEIYMAVLTDITEKRALESQMEAERNTLKMVVRIMVDFAEFSAGVKDYRKFMDLELEQLAVKQEPMKDKLLVLFRLLHTYKGTFAQWGLSHTTAKLHEAESLLSRLIKEPMPPEPAELLSLIRSLGLIDALEADLQVLKDNVGDHFFEDRDVLVIDKARLLEIEKKMLGTLSPLDCKLLLPELRKLRYKPFKEMLKGYPGYALSLAERMEKYIHPFEITGEDFLADTDKFGDLGRSLIHVFRNAIDHGIETAEERSAAGKEEYANLICRIGQAGGMITLMIADDGKGIDTDALRARAAAAGIVDAETLRLADELEVQQLIFRDEMSTKEQVSELSGRGIGLSSVKAEVELLGGEIAVASERGKGTVFHITLPADDLSGLPQLGLPAAVEPIVETTEHFFRTQADIGFRMPHEPLAPSGSDKLSLQKVTTFINVRGAVEGIFVLSVDDPLSRALLRHMVIGGLPPEEEDSYVEEGLAEAANIILGNSLRKLDALEEFILMDPPITFHTEGASVKYADSDIWTCRLHAEEGSLLAGFVVLKKSHS